VDHRGRPRLRRRADQLHWPTRQLDKRRRIAIARRHRPPDVGRADREGTGPTGGGAGGLGRRLGQAQLRSLDVAGPPPQAVPAVARTACRWRRDMVNGPGAYRDETRETATPTTNHQPPTPLRDRQSWSLLHICGALWWLFRRSAPGMRRSDQEGSYAPEIGFRSGIPSHRDAREGRGTDVGPDSRGTEQRHGQPGATTGPPAHRRAATTRRQRIRGPRNTGCPGGSFEANFATARRKGKSRPVCNAKYGPARHYRRAGAAGLRPALPRRRPPAAPLAGNDRCDRSAASRWDGWSSTMATVAVRAATPTSVAPLSGTRLPFSGCSVFCGPPEVVARSQQPKFRQVPTVR
jgi:hypothetical protein